MREKLSRVEEELKEILQRWKWVSWIMFGAGLILIGRLWYLQIIHGDKLRQYSEINRLKETKIQAPRGLIFDRYGHILVDNLLDLELTITPQYISNLKQAAKEISPIVKIPFKQIMEKVWTGEKNHGPFRPVVIKKHLTLTQTTLLKLLQWDYTGVDIQPAIIRHYPLKKNGAHLFGYLSEITKNQVNEFNKKYGRRFQFQPGDWIGRSGLESVWEYELRGHDGFSFVEVDARNRKSTSNIAGLWSFKPKPAIPGRNLILTIDKKLQEKAYSSFLRNDKIGTRHGSALVMKNNGEILAWVSYPSYDPNRFSRELSPIEWIKLARNPSRPFRNKPVQDHYAPGSIFKPFVALAGLQEGIITPDTLVDSPKEITFGRRTYHDYRKTGHGLINLSTALERSANVFFYKLGIEMGIDLIAKYARLFYLGNKTNIKMEEEIPGLIPDSKWKVKNLNEAWQPGENLVHAIGQGFILVTPLQMAVAYNAIATSGKIVQPFLVQKITDINSKEIKSFSPKIIRTLDKQIAGQHFKTIRKALRQVVHGSQGTARWWKIKEVEIAGKTGTAQVMSFSKESIHEKCHKKPREQRHHGWFVAMAPAEEPEITVTVLTEHSCSGSGGSAPIARDIIQFYFKNKKDIIADHKTAEQKIAEQKIAEQH